MDLCVRELFGDYIGSNSTNETISCPDYDSTEFKVIAGLRAGLGALSALCCLAVIYVIISYKKYRFYAQRLILYLALTAFLQSILCALSRVNYYTSRPIVDPYCFFASFLHEYSCWAEVVSIVCITFNVFSIGVLQKETARLEIAYVAIIFLLPLSWSWVPFLYKAYGTAGPWCGVRTVTEDCEMFKFGQLLRLVIWTPPLYGILIISFVLTCITAYKVHRSVNRWAGKFSPDLQQRVQDMAKEVQPLLWYPAVFLVLETPSLANQIYHARYPFSQLLPLWYLEAVLGTLRGAFIASVYAFDSETRARMRCRHLCSIIKSCFTGEHDVTEYTVIHGDDGDSVYVDRTNKGESLNPLSASLSGTMA